MRLCDEVRYGEQTLAHLVRHRVLAGYLRRDFSHHVRARLRCLLVYFQVSETPDRPFREEFCPVKVIGNFSNLHRLSPCFHCLPLMLSPCRYFGAYWKSPQCRQRNASGSTLSGLWLFLSYVFCKQHAAGRTHNNSCRLTTRISCQKAAG